MAANRIDVDLAILEHVAKFEALACKLQVKRTALQEVAMEIMNLEREIGEAALRLGQLTLPRR